MHQAFCSAFSAAPRKRSTGKKRPITNPLLLFAPLIPGNWTEHGRRGIVRSSTRQRTKQAAAIARTWRARLRRLYDYRFVKTRERVCQQAPECAGGREFRVSQGPLFSLASRVSLLLAGQQYAPERPVRPVEFHYPLQGAPPPGVQPTRRIHLPPARPLTAGQLNYYKSTR